MIATVELNADVLDSIANAADKEIAAQGSSQAEARAAANHVIDVVWTQVGQVAIIQIDAQLQLVAQEPRLDERNRLVLRLGADGQAQAEPLAAALEPRRVRMEQ